MDTEVRLIGRDSEVRRIGALLGHARNGQGGALLLVGDPGIGKTSLLEATTAVLPGMQLLRVDGYEAESTIPFAALHRLTIPLRDHLADLPERHQQALRVAAGTVTGPPPDRFLVGLGVLGLLAAAGESGPLVCVVDDAHLLDSESLDVLAFVGRRLEAEAVALLLAARPSGHLESRVAGIDRLQVTGLSHHSAIQLLTTSLSDPLDPAIAAQVVAATGGNPLALVDLASELSVKQLMESSLADEPFPVGQHLEAFYVRQVRALSDPLQEWLLVVAADSTRNIDLIRRATGELGLAPSLGDEAEKAGLVEMNGSVAFRHPLVGSAAYNAAHGHQRRRVHAALAPAADGLGLVELEAWHAAKATLGTDPDVAQRLERVADLAGQRGGSASRASVLVQSSALTPEGPVKYKRLVGAAEAALASGAAHLAKSFLDDVDDSVLDPVARGRMISVRAHYAVFVADPALKRAGSELLAAAAQFREEEPSLEQKSLLEAFYFTLPGERLAEGGTLEELGLELRDGARRHDGVGAILLEALSAHILLPYAEAVPLMRRAVDAIRDLPTEQMLELGLGSVALTSALWDAPLRRTLLERTAAVARDVGSLQLLDTALWTMSNAELKGGTPRQARHDMDQVRELRRAIGYDAEHVINVALLAWTDVPRSQVEMIAEGAGAIGFGGVQAAGQAGLAVRDLAEGLYDDAFDRLRPLVEDPFLQVTPLEYPDYVEAGARSGRSGEVTPQVELLEEMAAANGSSWNRGLAERSRALVDGVAAEPHFRSALEHLRAGEVEVEVARTHLLYGEWLRRARRRREAADHLRRAATMFERCEAPWFTERARHELEAAGGTAGGGSSSPDAQLTVQEMTVARLAASGNTNAEIGATMFLSPNTVDYHLRKVFRKLGVSSRRQLSDRLAFRD